MRSELFIKHKLFIFGIIIATTVMAIDQLHKYYMIEVFDITNNQFSATNFLDIVMVWNRGISFGMFQNPAYGVYIFTALSLSICIFLLVWLKRNDDLMTMWALGLIIGGAIGNVIDRLNYGAVADFFYFHIGDLGWPAFNIADSAVFLGAIMICVESLFFHEKKDVQEDIK